MLLVRFADGRTRAVDGHSRAPAVASRGTVKVGEQRRGHRACTIPSMPATLDRAQEISLLRRESVGAPAIRGAEESYPVPPSQHRQTQGEGDYLRASPARKLFLRNGQLPEIGSTFRQPVLAATLRWIADLRIEDFYPGGIAQRIAADTGGAGDLITEEDLASCDPLAQVEPVSTAYRDHWISSSPPAGGRAWA